MSEHQAKDAAKDAASKVGDAVSGVAADARATLDQGKTKVQDLQNAAGDAFQQAKSTVQDLGNQAQDIARRAREQAGAAAGTVYEAAGSVYEQSARATDYVSRNVEANPLVALLIAGAVGYGLAYLVHRQ